MAVEESMHVPYELDVGMVPCWQYQMRKCWMAYAMWPALPSIG